LFKVFFVLLSLDHGFRSSPFALLKLSSFFSAPITHLPSTPSPKKAFRKFAMNTAFKTGPSLLAYRAYYPGRLHSRLKFSSFFSAYTPPAFNTVAQARPPSVFNIVAQEELPVAQIYLSRI
jgi:hypothetical protein